MLKKTITKEEFIELSKVMDEREIIEQYNIADQNQTNIFQKVKQYLVNSIRFVIGNLGLLKKIVVPVLTLAVIGSGYYGYQKYAEQIGWYKWQVNELEEKIVLERGNVKESESKISKLQTDLDDKTNKIKNVEKNVSDLENKVSDKETIISQKEKENNNLEGEKQSAENKSKNLAEKNTQTIATSKANQNYLIKLGNVKACILSNLSENSYYSCEDGAYKSISCFGSYTHTCTYYGQNFSCDITIFKTGIENCK